MSKSLTNILNESLEIERAIIESFGEITPAIADKLTINEIEQKEKLDSYEVIMNRLELNETYFKQKAAELKMIEKSFAQARESMRERIKYFMIEKNLDEVRGSDARFKLTKTTPSLKIDPDLIQDEYKFQLISIEIDREKIKADLKDGKEVIGASLEQGLALRKFNIGASK